MPPYQKKLALIGSLLSFNSNLDNSCVTAFSSFHTHSHLNSHGTRTASTTHPFGASIGSSSTTTSLFSTDVKKLSRPERKALERQKKEAQKNGTSGPKAKVKAQTTQKYELHSNNVSELTLNSSADDVIQAIKRAQNRHDVHDLRIISKFLLEEVDESFGYGFRGSLLARLAVAALHMSNDGAATCEIAVKAIELRRQEYRCSMLPMESAAIIRGLLRIHNVTDAFDTLNDELSVPLEGTPLDLPENQEKIKHRAYSIASIASRHFYEGEPSLAVKACAMLTELGPVVRESGLTTEALNMPWARIIQGAAQCESGRRNGSITSTSDDSSD